MNDGHAELVRALLSPPCPRDPRRSLRGHDLSGRTGWSVLHPRDKAIRLLAVAQEFRPPLDDAAEFTEVVEEDHFGPALRNQNRAWGEGLAAADAPWRDESQLSYGLRSAYRLTVAGLPPSAMNRSTMPRRARTSETRYWSPMAFECTDGPGPLLNQLHRESQPSEVASRSWRPILRIHYRNRNTTIAMTVGPRAPSTRPSGLTAPPKNRLSNA